MSRQPPIVTARNGIQRQVPDSLIQQQQLQDLHMQAEHQQQDEGYASSTPTSSLTWIAWFCSLPGHEYFCEVAEDFIEDDFNLTGLSAMVPFWKEAMEMVLDVEPEDTVKIPDVSIVEASAELLYGLVHQRYVLTRPGLQAMAERYENGVFGSCLRVYCSSTRLVPCGRSDMPGVDTVKLYCPNCNDIYTPSSSRYGGVDGAFFGTTFAHLFFHTYREYAPVPFIPKRGPASPPSSQTHLVQNPNPYGGQKRPEHRVYVPRIYGFKVSERSRSGPRMAWVRMRPASHSDLAMVDSKGRWIADSDESSDDQDDSAHRGPRERFDDGENDEENIEEDEEEEEDDQPPPPPPPTQLSGRRPVVRGGEPGPSSLIANRVKRAPMRRRPTTPPESDSSDSELETPNEDASTPSTARAPSSPAQGGKKCRAMAALRLAMEMQQPIDVLFPKDQLPALTSWRPRAEIAVGGS